MGELMGYDEWLQAQNCLLGAALIDPELVPRVVTELSADDFSGNGLLVYKAMADLFRASKTPTDVDAVAVSQYLGNTDKSRALVAHFMGCSPNFSEIDRYISMAKDNAKVSRLRALGSDLAAAVDLDDALSAADAITAQLMHRPGLKGYEPKDLVASFRQRHTSRAERYNWKLREVGDFIRMKKGNFLILGAEPSGGKTAFALEQMWAFSETHRVLFVSLETDEGTIFDRLISSYTKIPMDALMDSRLSPMQWKIVEEASHVIAQRQFKILPAAGLTVSGIKAAALSYKADIVIIDYLQIIQMSGRNNSRYEAITEISMDLHIMAQSTGLIVIALSQVTNRDPQARGKPLGIHSARESGQIEADADAILMLDKFVEKGLRESGSNANRILRVVKNKNGQCVNIPLRFDGKYQTFAKAYVPDPEWEAAQAANPKRKKADGDGKASSTDEDGFCQLDMNLPVPF